jgi:hypothetical protein
MKPNGLRLVIVSQGYSSSCLNQDFDPDWVLGMLPIAVKRLRNLSMRAYRRQHHDHGSGNAPPQRYHLSGLD